MRLTEFWSRMDRRFGAEYARSVAADQVLADLDGMTVDEALGAGRDAKEVWRAVVAAFGETGLDRGPAGRRAGATRGAAETTRIRDLKLPAARRPGPREA